MVYGPQHGQVIQAGGTRMLKRPNLVFMLQVPDHFQVSTNEGVLNGEPHGYVAYDPISGHVWPVSALYVSQHYDEAPEEKAAEPEKESEQPATKATKATKGKAEPDAKNEQVD